MKLDESNQLVFPIAVGSPSAYSWYPEEEINEDSFHIIYHRIFREKTEYLWNLSKVSISYWQ